MLPVIRLLAAAAASASPAAEQPHVVIRTEGTFRLIESNGIANHETGRFPNRNNPNPIQAKSYSFRVPLRPRVAASPIPTGYAWFGVALNGVPFEPGTQEFWKDDRSSGWHYEAIGGESNLGIDRSLAHVQPNGAYHYHGSPLGLIETLGGENEAMRLIGWSADGFPVYGKRCRASDGSLREMRPGYRLRKGSRPTGAKDPGGTFDGNFTEDYEYVEGLGDLDACNGHAGPTPEFPEGTYHYHATTAFPMLPRFWRGAPDTSFQKHGPPPGATPRKPRRPDDTGAQGR